MLGRISNGIQLIGSDRLLSNGGWLQKQPPHLALKSLVSKTSSVWNGYDRRAAGIAGMTVLITVM
jgi:hypothetical protein